MYKDFWTEFYKRNKGVHYPTPFAEFCQERYMREPVRLLDVGTGNGRDAFYFAEKGHHVVGVDQCEAVIARNREIAEKWDKTGSVCFYSKDIAGRLQIITDEQIMAVYCRFVLHAIQEEGQDFFCREVYQRLPAYGWFFLEFRTDKDPMMNEGKPISDDERLTDHYRRFINANHFVLNMITMGFELQYFCESCGLAVYGDEDPIVARCIFQKK